MRKLSVYFFSLLLAMVLLPVERAHANATIKIVNGNAPGVGFNDPTPRTPVGGNPGTTLGEQRLNAFQKAAEIWGSTIDSPVEIDILATFEPLACTANAATLGSAGTTNIFSFPNLGPVGSFPGPAFTNTWYHFALADKRVGSEILAGTPHIRARFNSNIGAVGCLTGTFWYYGFDNNHGTNIDLLTVLLHEFAHGLGFSQFASVASGAQIQNLTDIYGHQILDDTTGKTWDAMTNAERVASAINSRKVVWNGATVTNALPGVLQKGVPNLQITPPSAIAGTYEVGTASFGPPLSAPGVSGSVVVGVDPSDAAGPTTTDGCSALTNGAQVAGKIALLDRGTCGFIVKVKNAQNAGAIGVLIADNVAGSPPAGLGGTDPTITIPSVRISQSDGNLIKQQLTAGNAVNVTLGVDPTRFAGADASGRALLYTPNPVAPGSTISHWDTIATPNQLMEPAINGDLTHNVQPPNDLTLPLLRDVGWFPDEDNDGVEDNVDDCHGSDLRANVIIGSCDTAITNELFSNGCTIKDLINKSAPAASNHGQFVSFIAHFGNALRDAGLISGEQKGALQSCAAQAH